MQDVEARASRGAAPQAAPARPDVTVVVPTYERANYLEICLKHHVVAFDEAGIDYEILVCDNASGEEARAVAERWAARSPRVRVVRQPRNLGGFANALYGARHARGRVVVTVGDDDLLIPETVAAYVEAFRADETLVMIQAPWFIMNELLQNKIVGVSYQLEAPVRIERGDFRAAAELVLSRRIFPEVYAVRADKVEEIVGGADEIAYHYFVVLARAVEEGAVLFTPTPHAIVTGVSRHGAHAGNAETVEGWDKFRGGMELLLGRAREKEPEGDFSQALRDLESFVLDRMATALRFQIGRRAWRKAWLLWRRLRAYGVDVLPKRQADELLPLAAMESTLQEAEALGAEDVVLADPVYAIYLNVVDLKRCPVPVHCEADWRPALRRGRTAFVGMGRKRGPDDHPDDLVLDLAAAMRRIS